MEGKVNIEIEKLRHVVNAVFDHLDRRGVESLDIDGPMYWHIDPADRYSMAKAPVSLNVGSLNDDYEDIMRVASGLQPVLTWHLVPLASVLEAIGTMLSEKLAGEGG
jgi:hypothetical protein